MSDISLNYSSCSCHHTLQCPPLLPVQSPLQCCPLPQWHFSSRPPVFWACPTPLTPWSSSCFGNPKSGPQVPVRLLSIAADACLPRDLRASCCREMQSWGPAAFRGPVAGPLHLDSCPDSPTRSSRRKSVFPDLAYSYPRPQAAASARLNVTFPSSHLGALWAVGLDSVPSQKWASHTTYLRSPGPATVTWALSTKFLLLCHPEEKKQDAVSVTAVFYKRGGCRLGGYREHGWDLKLRFYYCDHPNTIGRFLAIYKTIWYNDDL